MKELTITVRVAGDPVTEDPHEVAEELIADSVELARRFEECRHVEFVSAEWTT